MSNESLLQKKKFDKMNPILRYEALKTSELFACVYDKGNSDQNAPDRNADLGEIILISLYIIDSVVREQTNSTYFFYINNDVSIKHLLDAVLDLDLGEDLLLKHLLELDVAKLIYRFTCAKKFQIGDDSIKQLRLNSWGREHLSEGGLLKKHSFITEKIDSYFREYYLNNKLVYQKLTGYLLGGIDSYTSQKISKLNDALKIKLLS